MTEEDFEVLLKSRLKKTEVTLSHKANEYAIANDRLHNFHVAARILGTTPENALLGMANKHLVSVLDLIRYPGTVTPERVDEKIGDLINYLILLEAVFKETMNATALEG